MQKAMLLLMVLVTFRVIAAAADTTDREHKSVDWTRDARHLSAWKELVGEADSGGEWGGFRRNPCGLFGEARGSEECNQEDDFGRGGHDNNGHER